MTSVSLLVTTLGFIHVILVISQTLAVTVFSDKKPECAFEEGTLCAQVWNTTHKAWLASSSHWLIAKPAAIIGILLGALVVRWLVHRAISRLTARKTENPDSVPVILRPLKERAPAALEATGLLSERRRQRADTIGSVLRSVSSAVIFVIAVMLVADQFEINLGPLLASAGIVGVALGFGAQTLVKDYLAGMSMMLEDQYGVGDVVNLGDATGTVEAIGLRVTKVRDVKGIAWYVRNGEIIRVGNLTQGWARAVVDIPVPFGINAEDATEVIAATARTFAQDEKFRADLLEDPEVLGVNEISAVGMMLRVMVKTTSAGQWTVARELRERIMAALQEAGIPSGWPVDPTGANGTKTSP